MKLCPKCGDNRDFDQFYKNYRTPDGYAYTCKFCMAAYSKKHKQNNAEKIAANKKKWYQTHRDKVLEYQKQFYIDNKSYIVDRVIAYRKQRLKSDPVFRLNKNIRHRVAKALKQKNSKSVSKLVGCSLDELKSHIEKQFLPGMTWDNYGEWHVDHVKPLANFDLSVPEQLAKAAHYTNLQPLWAADNLKKNRH